MRWRRSSSSRRSRRSGRSSPLQQPATARDGGWRLGGGGRRPLPLALSCGSSRSSAQPHHDGAGRCSRGAGSCSAQAGAARRRRRRRRRSSELPVFSLSKAAACASRRARQVTVSPPLLCATARRLRHGRLPWFLPGAPRLLLRRRRRGACGRARPPTRRCCPRSLKAAESAGTAPWPQRSMGASSPPADPGCTGEGDWELDLAGNLPRAESPYGITQLVDLGRRGVQRRRFPSIRPWRTGLPRRFGLGERDSPVDSRKDGEPVDSRSQGCFCKSVGLPTGLTVGLYMPL